MVDIAPFDDSVDPVAQAKASSPSSKKYDPALYDKPRWLVLNKLDMVPADERAERVKDFVKRLRWKGPVFEISALTREGCEPLVRGDLPARRQRRPRSAGRASTRASTPVAERRRPDA